MSFQLSRDSLQAHEPVQRLSRIRRQGYQRLKFLRNYISLAWFYDKRWFIIAVLAGMLIRQLPTPEGLTHEGQIVLSMSVVATILFVTEPVPLPTVPLLIIVGQVILLKLAPNKVAQSIM